jgi:hypothetical protein
MGASWNFPDNFQVERGPDQVVIRSEWGQLIPSIGLGACYIGGLCWIMQANGMLSESDWDAGTWMVVSLLISAGLFIMVPRRLTVSFDCQNRKAVRAYQFAFGLITRRREIPFDDIACVAVENGVHEGEAFSKLAIRQNDAVISLLMKEGSRDETLGAAQAISSATGIALEET